MQECSFPGEKMQNYSLSLNILTTSLNENRQKLDLKLPILNVHL